MLDSPTELVRGLVNNCHPLQLRLAVNTLVEYIERDAADHGPESGLTMFDVLDILTQMLISGEVRLSGRLTASDIESIVAGETGNPTEKEN